MLVHDINITDDDIAYAEKILLKEGQTFKDENNERIDFIKDLSILDLQAVPGSGKTTALLAKILILEKYLPFDDGSGILIISHTNTAIDEIKNRIGKYCPKLFSYPNFVGTIQSFVNKFLAIPYYKKCFKRGIIQIDNLSYDKKFENCSNIHIKKISKDISNKAKLFLKIPKNLHYRFKMENDKLKLLEKFNGKDLKIEKPKGRTRIENYKDWNVTEKEEIEKWLIKYKLRIMEEGILHYDDMYFLAESYIQKQKRIKKILQKRFSVVFVDEMQDMGKHQYDLLEKIFFEDNVKTIFQRIGDINQAIYSGENIEIDLIWEPRKKVLKLTGTNRFSQSIANFVQNFGIKDIPISSLQKNSLDLKPHILIYNDENIKQVIPKFSQIIKEYVENEKFVIEKDKPCKAIAWVKKIKDEGKITLPTYCENFVENHHKVKETYPNLKSYLLYFEKGNNSFKNLRKNIINAFLNILRLENIKDENDRFYTKTSLINILKEKQLREKNSIYDKFNLKIFKWCKLILIYNEIETAHNEIKIYVNLLLYIFGRKINESKTFIDDKSSVTFNNDNSKENTNIYNKDGFDIHISTVHKVKGETHTATLYLESFYQKKYESERHINQFKFNNFSNNKKYDIQSTKMAYVGFSRPTNLLCIAIHEDRFNKISNNLNNFEIMYI